MLHYIVKSIYKESVSTMDIHVNRDEISTNARVRYLPDEDGVYRPYELVCFPRRTFIPPGWESSENRPKKSSSSDDINSFFDSLEATEFSRLENRRKSYNRARNNLFNLCMSTLSFNCFVTLTFDNEQVDRYSYDAVMKKLTYWLDNRVRRNSLDYVFVPEFHKDKAVHLHGLCNFEALKTVRARSPYTGKLKYDSEGRPIYNLADFPFGFSTVIPLSGDNARIATAKYCYKYIVKSGGEMVGGRYYLSGGNLGRPQFKLINVDYDSLPCDAIKVGGIIELKKLRLDGADYKKYLSNGV